MNEKEIKEVLVEMGMRFSDLKILNGWVSTRCVLARWTHDRGTDSSASAGVSLKGDHIYNCLTCKTKIPLYKVLKKYGEYTGDNFDDLIEEMEENAYLGPRTLPSWDELKQTNEEEVVQVLDEVTYMDLYDSAVGHPYLRSRGISDATAKKLELLYDPEDPVDKQFGIKVPRILFPVRTPDGGLIGFSGRDVSGRSLVKVRDYHGLPKAHVLLGSHLITQERPDKLIIVEGLFDYANGIECGMPVAAVLHSGLTEFQARLIRNIGLPVFPIYDNPKIDKAGAGGIRTLARQLFDDLPVMNIRYPEVWIEDDTEEDGGHWLKDPGEMLREDFETILKDARAFLTRPD